jgi:hypothetical protein
MFSSARASTWAKYKKKFSSLNELKRRKNEPSVLYHCDKLSVHDWGTRVESKSKPRLFLPLKTFPLSPTPFLCVYMCVSTSAKSETIRPPFDKENRSHYPLVLWGIAWIAWRIFFCPTRNANMFRLHLAIGDFSCLAKLSTSHPFYIEVFLFDIMLRSLCIFSPHIHSVHTASRK